MVHMDKTPRLHLHLRSLMVGSSQSHCTPTSGKTGCLAGLEIEDDQQSLRLRLIVQSISVLSDNVGDHRVPKKLIFTHIFDTDP